MIEASRHTPPAPHRDSLGELEFRLPLVDDGPDIHALVADCPPLDLNACYAYLLLAQHFSRTCIVAASPQQLLGFISGYVPPQQPDTLFIWQVAVHEHARGLGLARRMLGDLLSRPWLGDIRYLETTVGPSNQASRALFARIARDLDADLTEHPLFARRHFGAQAHEDEPLLRIGPFDRRV